MINRSKEDYLKTIYEIGINTNNPIIKISELAESLGFTDQSVHEMIKKLVNDQLTNYIPYKGVSLTQKGNKEAIRLIRAHRVWEVFLLEELKYTWNEVHELAEKLEHIGDDKLVERLHQYLNSPKYCIHGNPIPSTDGLIENIYTKPLFEYKVGETFVLKRVMDYKTLLQFLSKEGMKINDQYLITNYDNFNGLYTLKKGNKEFFITNKLSKMLFSKR